MITISTKAQVRNLVTLADLKTAIAPGDDDDAYLGQLIERATDLIERQTRRKFGRAIVAETFNGSGRTDKSLGRFPVVDLGVLTHDSATIATTEYKILDSDAGMVFMQTGWLENVRVSQVITMSRLDQPGDSDYSLAYTAGYLLSGDNVISGVTITSNGAGKTFTLSSGKWPLLVDGDFITFAGFADSSLNDTFTVAERTSDLILTVDETPGADEAASVTFSCQTLPTDLEQACIDLINSWFQWRSRDRSLKSEKIGDWSASYQTSAVPSSVQQVINTYKVIF
jgi:hypothetical protein